MADLDLNQPLPDAAHEGLRQAVVKAITDLTQNTTDVEDSFYIADIALALIDSLFVQLDQTTADLASLTQRVAALELHHP